MKRLILTSLVAFLSLILLMQACTEQLKQFGTSIQAGAVLFQDFITKVLKIPNLAELIATGGVIRRITRTLAAYLRRAVPAPSAAR